MATINKQIIEATITEVLDAHPYTRRQGMTRAVAEMAADYELVLDVAARLNIMGNEALVNRVWTIAGQVRA
jgi:hypothetical protein